MYCDSHKYSEKVDSIGTNQFFNFISKIVKHGISSSTYSERADLIIDKMNLELQSIEYDITLAKCDSTFGNVLEMMLGDFPSVKEIIKCSSNCELSKKSTHSLVYLTYVTTNGKINDIQQLLNDRQRSETSICGRMDSEKICDGIKEIIFDTSEMHILIDILYWEGKLSF